MITFVIAIVAVLVLFSALWYAIGALAPEPVAKYLRVGIVILAAIFIAYLLLGLSPETIRLR